METAGEPGITARWAGLRARVDAFLAVRGYEINYGALILLYRRLIAFAAFAVVVGAIGGTLSLVVLIGDLGFYPAALVAAIVVARCIPHGLVKPIGVASLVCLIGLVPQLIFLAVYNAHLVKQPPFTDLIEPARLPALAAAYEDFIVQARSLVHDRLRLPTWLSIALAVAFYAVSVGTGHRALSKALETWGRWSGRVLLALVAASSFTLLAPVPTGNWTPDLTQRIGVLERVETKARVEQAVARQFIAQAGQAELLKSLAAAAADGARPVADPCSARPGDTDSPDPAQPRRRSGRCRRMAGRVRRPGTG